jgi:hypothetical protein
MRHALCCNSSRYDFNRSIMSGVGEPSPAPPNGSNPIPPLGPPARRHDSSSRHGSPQAFGQSIHGSQKCDPRIDALLNNVPVNKGGVVKPEREIRARPHTAFIGFLDEPNLRPHGQN